MSSVQGDSVQDRVRLWKQREESEKNQSDSGSPTTTRPAIRGGVDRKSPVRKSQSFRELRYKNVDTAAKSTLPAVALQASSLQSNLTQIDNAAERKKRSATESNLKKLPPTPSPTTHNGLPPPINRDSKPAPSSSTTPTSSPQRQRGATLGSSTALPEAAGPSSSNSNGKNEASTSSPKSPKKTLLDRFASIPRLAGRGRGEEIVLTRVETGEKELKSPRKATKGQDIEIKRAGNGEKGVQQGPVSPRVQHRVHMSAIPFEVTRNLDEKADRETKGCYKGLGSMHKIVQATEGFIIPSELLVRTRPREDDSQKIFAVSNALINQISNLNFEMQILERKKLIELYKTLFLDTDLFFPIKEGEKLSIPQDQEKRIDELRVKVVGFVKMIEKLKKTLKEKDVDVLDAQKKSIKQPILEALISFTTEESVKEGGMIQKNERFGKRFQDVILNLNKALTHEDSAEQAFNELNRFFASLNELTEVILKATHSSHFSVVTKKGEPARTYLGKNNSYSQNESCETAHLLDAVGREINQYSNLIEGMLKNAIAINAFVMEHALPFPSQKNVINLNGSFVSLKTNQRGLNSHDSLFEPLPSPPAGTVETIKRV